MNLFNNIYGVLFRPSSTFKHFDTVYESQKSNLFLQAFSVYLLSSLIANQLSASALIDSTIGWLSMYFMVFLAGFVFKLSWKDYPKLLTFAAFACLPMIFLAPIDLLNDHNEGLGTLLVLGTSIWSFSLNIRVVSELCQISKTKVVLLYSLPLIFILILLVNLLSGIAGKPFQGL